MMRSAKISLCLMVLVALVGCGDGAYDYNQALVKVRDQAKLETADVIEKLQTFDGSDAEAKAIDDAYAKVLESVKAAKASLASVKVPAGVEKSQEIYDAVKAFMDGVESMLTEDWAAIIPLLKKAKLAQGAERADLYAQLRLLAGKLQSKSQTIDTAMHLAQAEFAKANKMRLEN